MLGAIIGDIVGSVYEFNNYRAKDFEPFFHPECFFTDDTVCTAAVAESLTQHVDPAVSLREWGRRYWQNGGWGMRFAQWLGSDDEGPYNSYGNGAGMRVSPAGFLARTLDEAIRLSDRVTEVTHNHPEGMKGAAATAAAIFLARSGMSASDIRQKIVDLFGYDLSQSVDEIRQVYRYNERAQDTVPQALTCALEAISFEDAIRNSISIGGDSDTIAAIAGGVAEALFGIPEQMAEFAWSKLPHEMQAVMVGLYNLAEHRSKNPDAPKIMVAEGNVFDQRDCDGLVILVSENPPEFDKHDVAIDPNLAEDIKTYRSMLPLGAAIACQEFSPQKRRVILARIPENLSGPESEFHLAGAIENALRVGDREQLTQMAVSVAAMSLHAYQPQEAVPILVGSARKMLPRLHYIQEVRFVVVQSDLRNLFHQHIRTEP